MNKLETKTFRTQDGTHLFFAPGEPPKVQHLTENIRILQKIRHTANGFSEVQTGSMRFKGVQDVQAQIVAKRLGELARPTVRCYLMGSYFTSSDSHTVAYSWV